MNAGILMDIERGVLNLVPLASHLPFVLEFGQYCVILTYHQLVNSGAKADGVEKPKSPQVYLI